MAEAKFYLDTRSVRKDGSAPLKIMVSHCRKTVLIPLKVYLLPDQWENNEIINHANKKVLNVIVASELTRVRNVLYDLRRDGKLRDMPVQALKRLLIGEAEPVTANNLANYFKGFCNRCRKESTARIYMVALSKIKEFIGDEDKFNSLTFEDINKAWLGDFQAFMLRSNCLNSSNVHMRSLRAVFNDAIDNEVTVNYPFRRFKLKKVQTRKRSLTVEQLRMLFDYPVEDYQRKYVDVFKLMFMLCGINMIDLCGLTEISNEGRIEYNRAKTYRFYSIKVEPEAMEIIDRLRGEHRLLGMAERYKDYNDVSRHMSEALKRIGEVKRSGLGGKKDISPLFPDISPYWARHTWATIAADLDVPDAVISQALGHGPQNSVTEIYIRRNLKKVDEANRRVLDWVLYGRR